MYRNSGCDALISQTIKSFLAVGGDMSWVKNIKTAPVKLQRLREMTEIFWKYPWKLTNHNIKVRLNIAIAASNLEETFQSLTVGKESWTLSEIVQAVGKCTVLYCTVLYCTVLSHNKALFSDHQPPPVLGLLRPRHWAAEKEGEGGTA